jgi:hypothetical protein
MEYILILVDSAHLSARLNLLFMALTTKRFRIQAFANGQAIIGLQHLHSRPTLVIDLMIDRERKGFDDWYNHCVKPTTVKAKVLEGR